MKAVIMAGGEGSRLRPLTCDLPKPMARLCGRPIMEYILDLLSRHGIQEAAVTVRYLPDRIVERFPDSRYREMELLFVEETEPLGTAGGVKNACLNVRDDVLVISGDALCDFDLTAAMRFHKESGAAATLIGKRVDDPREYGLIQAEPDGSIRAFIEKPAFSQAVSDIANTGIYLLSPEALDMIPAGKKRDFAQDLFPAMLDKGMKLMCWLGEGYWCDIGDLDTYLRCQRDMLVGRVDCDIHGQTDDAGNVFAGEIPENDYHIQAPVYFGKGVRVEDGALIESGSVIDDGCYVGHAARVTGSALLPGAYVGRRARLTGALVCAGASVKEGAMLFEGAAVGAGAVVGEKAAVHAGIKIWNRKTVSPSATVRQHVKTGGEVSGYFDDEGITGQVGVEITPEFCARVGAAAASLYPSGRIAVGCSPHKGAAVLASAVAAGIQSTGAGALDFGENFAALFAYAMNFCAAPLGIYVSGENRISLSLFGPGGLPANRQLERGVEGILSRGEFVRCAGADMGDIVAMESLTALYRSQLLRFAPRGLTGLSVQVRSRNLAVQNTLREILEKLGCDTGGQLLLELSSQGDKVRVYDPTLGYLPHHKILTLCAAWYLERGKDTAVPADAPRILDQIALDRGCRLLRYMNCPADDSDSEARSLAAAQMWSRDALMQSAVLLHLVRRAGGLRQLMRRIPEYETSSRTVSIAESPAGLMKKLSAQKESRITEGVVVRSDAGVVLVRPLKQGGGIRIMAEALSSEIAEELCADVEKKLLRESE